MTSLKEKQKGQAFVNIKKVGILLEESKKKKAK